MKCATCKVGLPTDEMYCPDCGRLNQNFKMQTANREGKMSRERVAETVIAILKQHLGEDAQEHHNLIIDLNADSLDLVYIAMECEEEFGQDYPDSDLEACVTVKELIDMIDSSQ